MSADASVSEPHPSSVPDERPAGSEGPFHSLDPQNTRGSKGQVGTLAYAVKSIIWVVVLGVLLFSVPIALSGFYAATIAQVRRLREFERRGWLYRLFSRRILKGVFWTCWALVSSFFMLIQFHTYSGLEWAAFFLVIPVFLGVFAWSRRFLARELRPFLVTHMALKWARWITPLIMVVLYVLLLLVAAGDSPRYDTLQQAVHAQKDRVAHMTGSALVYEVSHYLAYYDGAKAYFLGRLGGRDALLATGLLGLGGLVVFFNACAILSCFLIPTAEYRRVLGPPSDDAFPPPVTPRRFAPATALFTFAALFIYVPTFSAIEYWLRNHPEIARAREEALAWAVPRVEQIEDRFFRPGTIEQLTEARLKALHRVEVSMVYLDGQVDRAFDLMEANVDGYLDWYYSLPGEYARIMKLLLGEIEDYMEAKLEEHLLRGDPFKNVEAALSKAIREHEAAMGEYGEMAWEIMERNRVSLPEDTRFMVLDRMPLQDVLNPLEHKDLIDFKTRMGGGAAAGLVTAVVVAKVIGKLATKNIFKLAAKSVAKIVGGKAVGTAGGAAAGAAAGLAVGGPVGAVVGGFIGGVLAGISVDAMLLMLEEAVSREDFKQEILSAIREAKREFKDELAAG